MSGPFGVSMVVISGQKFGGEMVVAASTFLSMGYFSVTPVAAESTIRPAFLPVLRIFGRREKIWYRDKPEYFIQRVCKPDELMSKRGHFILALDTEGERLARQRFEAAGIAHDKPFYRSVLALNQLEQTISPPPEPEPPQVMQKPFWQKLFSPSVTPPAPAPKPIESYWESACREGPLTLEQASYYTWCERLYEALIPWMDTIKKIQSDYS